MKMRTGTLARLSLGVAGLCTAATGAAVGTVSWLAYRRLVHPVVGDYGIPEWTGELPHESVALTSRDGTRLAAWFVPGTRQQPVLLLHGYGATKKEMLHHASFLHAAGFPILLLDLRYCGESEGKAFTFGGREREDVAAALEYLQQRPDVDGEQIGILGLSLGGALAVLAAADCPAVRAVVTESSFRSIHAAVRRNFRLATRLPHFPFAHLIVWMVERRWGVKASRIAPEREIGALRDCAVLLIHSEADPVIAVEDAHALFSVANEPKELWLVPDADHALAYLTERETYAERVTAFLDRWLNTPREAASPAESSAPLSPEQVEPEAPTAADARDWLGAFSRLRPRRRRSDLELPAGEAGPGEMATA